MVNYNGNNTNNTNELERLNNYKNLEEEEAEEVVNWLLEKHINERHICENALDYFWFLNNNDIDRFNSTVNDNIFDDIKEYLDYKVDWKKWDGDLEVLIDKIKRFCEESMAISLKFELKESIKQVRIY